MPFDSSASQTNRREFIALSSPPAADNPSLSSGGPRGGDRTTGENRARGSESSAIAPDRRVITCRSGAPGQRAAACPTNNKSASRARHHSIKPARAPRDRHNNREIASIRRESPRRPGRSLMKGIHNHYRRGAGPNEALAQRARREPASPPACTCARIPAADPLFRRAKVPGSTTARTKVIGARLGVARCRVFVLP